MRKTIGLSMALLLLCGSASAQQQPGPGPVPPPIGANPSSTAGPTAINGSASTFMRSDAAPAVQPATANQQGLVTGNSLSGLTQYTVGSVFTSTADATAASASSAASLYGTGIGSRIIPANSVVAGTKFVLDLLGTITTPAGSTSTITVAINWGGTTLATVTSAAVVANETGILKVSASCTVRSAGSSGTMVCNGVLTVYNGTALAYISTYGLISSDPATINTTTSNLLDVTAIWSAITTTQSIVINQASLQVLN